MREIVLDTETTGTEALKGDRIVEIGCVELVNHVPTGQTYHAYLNPQRAMSEGAFRVHGLSDAFLADKPVFADVADALADFVDGARLVIHNASFDIGFLDMEFGRLERPPLPRAGVTDTLVLARRKHPGASNSLDALCTRYGIDNAKRTRHGALLDAELLAEVYIELIGGKQTELGLGLQRRNRSAGETGPGPDRPTRAVPLLSRLTPEETQAHAAFVAGLGAAPLWNTYIPAGPSTDGKDKAGTKQGT